MVVDGQIIVSTVDDVRAPRLQPTKTGSRRVVTLSPSLVEMVGEKAAVYAGVSGWLFTPDAEPPNPDRIGWWWRRSRELAGIDDAGASTTSATGQPPSPSPLAKTSAPSPTASATPTRR